MSITLRPTLTDEGFVTEIHHVTGEGENKGVVYTRCKVGKIVQNLLSRSLSRPPGVICQDGLRPRRAASAITSANWRTRPSNVIMRNFIGPEFMSDRYGRRRRWSTARCGGRGLSSILAGSESIFERFNGALDDTSASPNTTLCFPRHVVFPSADEETGLVVCGWRASKYTGTRTPIVGPHYSGSTCAMVRLTMMQDL